MPAQRPVYAAIFFLALLALFAFWSQVGGQDHLDLLPWHIKGSLSLFGAFAATKAAHAAASDASAWNGRTLRWIGLAALALALCGVASYYAHVTLEPEDQPEEEEEMTAVISHPLPPVFLPPQQQPL